MKQAFDKSRKELETNRAGSPMRGGGRPQVVTDTGALGNFSRIGGMRRPFEKGGFTIDPGFRRRQARKNAKAALKLDRKMDKKGKFYARRGQDMYDRARESTLNKENYRTGAEDYMRSSLRLGAQDTMAYSRANDSRATFNSNQAFRRDPLKTRKWYGAGSGKMGQRKGINRFEHHQGRATHAILDDGTRVPFDKIGMSEEQADRYTSGTKKKDKENS
jgi:hypothetical protein